MEENFTEDLRVVRTRKLLSTALFDLLETTPYEKISVIDICKKAMVHRATFYNHFESKEDLLEYTIDSIKEELFSLTIEKETYASPKEMYMTLIKSVLDYVTENRTKLLLILNKNSLEKANELILTTIKRSVLYLTGKNKYSDEYAVPINVLTDFIAGGVTNMGVNWLLSKDPCSKEELLDYFNILLNENVYIKHK